MYQTIFLYLVVILVYSARPSPPPEMISPLPDLALLLGLLTAFYSFVRWRCRRLAARGRGLGDQLLPVLYDRLQLEFQLGAVAVFITLIYGADLGSLIGRLPLIGRSEGLNTLFGLALFFLLQIIAWSESHRCFSDRILLIQPRSAYLRGRLRFALGLIAPWIVILLLSDLAGWWLPETARKTLTGPVGEISVFLVFLLVLTILAPPLLVWLWRCRPLPAAPLREAIAALCRRERIGYREIMLWTPFEGRMATAAVIGAFPFSRYLLLTPDLLRLLDPEEVIAVMSHELGHVRYRHLYYFLFFFLCFFAFNFLYYDLGQAWLLTTTPALKLLESPGATPEIFLSLLEIVPLLLLYLIFFRFVFGFFLRNFERQADLAALEIPGLGRHLVAAFEKLGWLLGRAGEKPNWHHYNIPQRIAFLKAALADPEVARAHHRRLRRALLAFLAIFFLLLGPGIYWQQSGLTEKLHCRYLTRRLERLIKREPRRAELYLALGSLQTECGNEIKAVANLEQALRLMPDNPEALNNLAWLLLTCRNNRLRDYPRALSLARRAAELKPEAYILDTLAEARWRNGDAAAAAALEEEILEKIPADGRTDYYRRQLQKFRRPPADQPPPGPGR
jgi:Zn-dependent protease with chaperone function